MVLFRPLPPPPLLMAGMLSALLLLLISPCSAYFQIRSQANPKLCVVPFTADKAAKSFFSPLVLRTCPQNATVRNYNAFRWYQDGDKVRHANTNLAIKALAGVNDDGVSAQVGATQEVVPVLWGYGDKAPYSTQYTGTPLVLNGDGSLQLMVAKSGSPKYCLQPAGGAVVARDVLLTASQACDVGSKGGLKYKFKYMEL